MEIFKINAQNDRQKIDRYALVSRHNVINTKMNPLTSLTVGNGRFAFTVDATGLQSFPVYYEHGVPLGTESEWGWGVSANKEKYLFEETLKDFKMYGRDISYPVQFNKPVRNRDAANYFRANPHRLQLGNIGLVIIKKDGSEALPADIQNIRQELDLWTGGIKSIFTIEGEDVKVITYGDAQADGIACKITSSLIEEKRLAVRIRFPYASHGFADFATNYDHGDKHRSDILLNRANEGVLTHEIDNADYQVALKWSGGGVLKKARQHEFILSSTKKDSSFSFTANFIKGDKLTNNFLECAQVRNSSIIGWKHFWESGGAVDFSACTDPRAKELERRVVLSQYLTKVQCAGNYPPQETGLTYNSWFGKAHLEMHWWHGVHFALWGRLALLLPSINWYDKIKEKGRAIAKRQGFAGIRWPKMVDNQGNESPSTVAPFLIWQQPHFIYFAELAYRAHKNQATLNKYKDLVFATADFMDSFAYYDQVKRRYRLGPGIITSQEVSDPAQTFNPTFELAYWYWGLMVAQKWKERLHQPRNKKWDQVMTNLSPLPRKGDIYLADEGASDSYTNPKYLTSHPAVLAAYGVLPYTRMIDSVVMGHTYDRILKTWNWSGTWGWDFPMMAMTAARLHRPEAAVDALLMHVEKNRYLPNGHNYQDNQLTIYLPGNGGLLTAIAMMCAGWDGSKTKNPGFPKNGKWHVKWEGLQKMP